MSGAPVFKGSVPLTGTFGDLLDLMRVDRTNVRYHFVHAEKGKLQERDLLKEHLIPAMASLVLVASKFYKLSAPQMGGAHISNSVYFKYVNRGAEDEYLQLKEVCWYQV